MCERVGLYACGRCVLQDLESCPEPTFVSKVRALLKSEVCSFGMGTGSDVIR